MSIKKTEGLKAARINNALINAIGIGKDIFSKLAKQIEVCLMTEAAIKGIKAGTMLRKMVKEGQKET